MGCTRSYFLRLPHHFLILLQGRDVSVKRPFKFENMWLEVEGFSNLSLFYFLA